MVLMRWPPLDMFMAKPDDSEDWRCRDSNA